MRGHPYDKGVQPLNDVMTEYQVVKDQNKNDTKKYRQEFLLPCLGSAVFQQIHNQVFEFGPEFLKSRLFGCEDSGRIVFVAGGWLLLERVLVESFKALDALEMM